MLRLIEVMAAFAIVLAALYGTLLLLRRYTSAPRRAGAVDMEVLGRMALGPRQGLAVVRVGGRTVALSTGEGGVHRLFDIDTADTTSTEDAPGAGTQLRGEATVRDYAEFGRGLQAAVGRKLSLLRRSAIATLLLLAVTVPAALEAQQTGGAAAAATGADVLSQLGPAVDLRVSDGSGPDSLRLSGTVGIIVMMGMLTLLPTLVLMMTSFTRIFVVLSFLKQAMGTQTAPPAQLVAAFALLLTGFVMQPTLSEANRTALQPWLNGEIEQAEMMRLGAEPFREFMLAQTRDRDIEAFVEMSQMEVAPASAAEVPLTVLMSAFVTSELKTAFQIGFLLFLPFIIIDLVVAAVLMSMGMFMLPPAMIALPFKLMLFVLVDGWVLVVQSVVASFR